jgi:hypothetical protein
VIIFTDQQHDTTYVFRRSKPELGELTHLTHGPLAGSLTDEFRSLPPALYARVPPQRPDSIFPLKALLSFALSSL